MKKLIENPDKFYKPAIRPSGHGIGKGFAKDNGGAIPSNLLQIPNTESNGAYVAGCKLVGAKRHPARFPARSEEHTSALQSLMRNSYAAFCLKKKNNKQSTNQSKQ